MNARSAWPGNDGSPWFRLGSVEVTTSLLVVLLNLVGLVLYVASPDGMVSAFALDSHKVTSGFLWQLVTWPLVPLGNLFFVALAVFLFWYFGNRLEQDVLGRVRMAVWVGGMTLGLGLLATLVGLLPLGGTPLAGMWLLELMVLLAFIAEYPNVRFLFDIPGWLVGVVLVGLQVAQLLALRAWVDLIVLLVGIALCAVLARSVGLLGQYQWIPAVRLPRRRRRLRSVPSSRSASSGARGAGRRGTSSPQSDQEELDRLLDKISAGGMDSLSARERKRLLELRERRRRG